MKFIFLMSMFLIPVLASAQDESSFGWMSWTLAVNAKDTVPGQWEGSDRLRAWLTKNSTTTKDSIRKADLYGSRALMALKHGYYDLAFADYEMSARLNPKSRGQVGWRYVFLLRDYARALAHLEAFDALTPNIDDPIDDYSVSYLKGRAQAGLKNYEQAIKEYTVAIANRENRHGPEWVDYRYSVARAVSYLGLRQALHALVDLDKALKNNPKSAMAHYHRGRALQLLGRNSEAREAYRDALFFVRSQPFERDFYYEQPDAAYEGQIEAALQALKP